MIAIFDRWCGLTNDGYDGWCGGGCVVDGVQKRKRANLAIYSSVVAPTGIEPVFRA